MHYFYIVLSAFGRDVDSSAVGYISIGGLHLSICCSFTRPLRVWRLNP